MKHAITAALDVISLLCDRQQKEMQNAMRNKVFNNRNYEDVLFVLLFYRVLILLVKFLSYFSTFLKIGMIVELLWHKKLFRH